jgi:hypothetical protein
VTIHLSLIVFQVSEVMETSGKTNLNDWKGGETYGPDNRDDIR